LGERCSGVRCWRRCRDWPQVKRRSEARKIEHAKSAYLFFEDAPTSDRFYGKTLGGEAWMRVRFKANPMARRQIASPKLMHARCKLAIRRFCSPTRWRRRPALSGLSLTLSLADDGEVRSTVRGAERGRERHASADKDVFLAALRDGDGPLRGLVDHFGRTLTRAHHKYRPAAAVELENS